MESPSTVRLTGSPRRRVRYLGALARRWAEELARDPAFEAERASLAGRVEADRAAHWLARVQALPYEPDDAGPVDVVETDLRRALAGGIDCEERSALVAALCAADGIGAEVAWMVQRGAPLDHVTALVWLGGDVAAWADATIPGARVGEHPRDAARRTGYRPHERGVA